MPHDRDRHLQAVFDKLLGFARIVGILGHRQVGKTTFLRANSAEYVTLDDEEALANARESPKRFVESLKGRRSGIDECQLVPGLFPALKLKVGTRSAPGRFILTGSVRFTSRKAIRESLTGRIVNIELLPFCLTEIEGEPLSSFLPGLLAADSLAGLERRAAMPASVHRARSKTIEKYLDCGGFPGLFHIRDERTRSALLADLIRTILDRDLRLVHQTSLPYLQIEEFCRLIAADPLSTLHAAAIKRKTRLQESTQKHLLHALESVFVLRRIPVEGDYRGSLFWFEDQLERRHFLPGTAEDDSDWVTLVYRNARAQFMYRLGEQAELFHYRTRGGARVPFAIRTREGSLGFIPVDRASDITLSLRRSAESFLKRYGRSKVLFVARHDRDATILSDRMAAVPAQALLF